MIQRPQTDFETAVYSYSLSRRLGTFVLLPTVAVVSVGLGALMISLDFILFGVGFVLFGGWLALLALFGLMMSSAITVGLDGIGTRNFGRALKFIRWRDITQVRRIRRWNASSRAYECVFYAFDRENPHASGRIVNLSHYPIAFSERIRGAQKIVETINEQSRRHQFPLVAIEPENSPFNGESGRSSRKYREFTVSKF